MSEEQRAILAIDPGPKASGWVYGDPTSRTKPVLAHDTTPNEELRTRILGGEWAQARLVVIEEFVSHGKPLDANCLWTVRWIGRFEEACRCVYRAYPKTLPRRLVKMVLCKNANAKDPDVTRIVCDVFGPGRKLAFGRKASPGPLYGVVGHEVQALGLALAYCWKEAFEKAQGKLFEFDETLQSEVMHG